MRYVPLVLLCFALPLRADDLGLKLPPGFRVTLWADHTLANDIYTMALDEEGRVVVSGPGYVRRLEDSDGDGKADKVTDVEKTKTGLMGLCYYQRPNASKWAVLSGDNELKARLLDEDWPQPRFDAMSGRWAFSEHGGHAVRFGPDGLYAIAGNDAGLSQRQLKERSPIRSVESGAILRFAGALDWDADAVAHGFRNPYDFDFTPYGDIITFDSDTERDFLLPWYSPTAVYHLMPGMHHGWRLPGYMRSLRRPDYYPDTVSMLADMGRGSPTAVCCYRHMQFPQRYRGGVFLADWTFGKIYYMPLIPDGSSYRKVPREVFVEPTGTNGFAPTAMRVAPDGSLFVSIGGRGTRGSVYRIEYLIDGHAKVIPPAEPATDLNKVLNAPQPLEAWSHARWEESAGKVPYDEFVRVSEDETETAERRIRAIEIMALQSPGRLNKAWSAVMRNSKSPLVRTRAVWALQFIRTDDSWAGMSSMTGDPHPRVRTEALLSLAAGARKSTIQYPLDLKQLLENLGHEDHRVRLAAARVASMLPARTRAQFLERHADLTPRTFSSLVVADTWPDPINDHGQRPSLQTILGVLERAEKPDERVDVYRTLMLCLGDWNLKSPRIELWSAYTLDSGKPKEPAYFRLVRRGIVANVLDHFPSKDPVENIEAARLLAMLADDSPEAVRNVQAQVTNTSAATSDFHYLTALTRLTAPRDDDQTRRVADALLGMEAKLDGRQLRMKQNWSARLAELTGELLRLHPGLDKVLAAHPSLVRPGHVVIAAKLTGASRVTAARRFCDALKADADFALSAELVNLVAELPAADVRPLFRDRWADRSLREAIVRHLADRPDEVDRERFLDVVETASGDTLQAVVDAISFLLRDSSPKNLVPLLLRLRHTLSDPKEAAVRTELVRLVNRQAGQGFLIREVKPNGPALASAYGPVFEWFTTAYPAEAKRLNAGGADEAVVRSMLPSVKWEAGVVERGRKLFADRGCQNCHGGSTRLGPDLAGVTRRLSRDDLLTSLVNPSRDVAPAYRVTNVDTKDGKRVSGIVVFESADGLMVQTETAETKRIAAADIESRSPSIKSLMPEGLLKGLQPEELADLFAYLMKQ